MKKTFTRWSLSIEKEGKRFLIGSLIPEFRIEGACIFLTRKEARFAQAHSYRYLSIPRVEKVQVTVETIL